jgi:carbamoyltransferase
LKDGQLAAAVEERKLSRQKQVSGLPEHSLSFCLKQANVAAREVNFVALVRPLDPSPEARTHLELRQRFPNSQLLVVDHHLAHAAAAYYPSPFEDAKVVTLDRSGDLRCGALWKAGGTSIELERELYFPDSLGHLFGRVTQFLGFVPGSDEHKVQWLSASGDGRFVDLFSQILLTDEWPRLERTYFDGDRIGQGGFSAKFYQELGLADGEAPPAPLHAHIAAGLQRAVEHTVIRMAGSGDRLCLGGGLGLNALLVEALEKCGNWREVYVQPAAGNSGSAIGAAAFAWHHSCRQTERVRMDHLFLGPSFSAEQIKQVLENCKLRFRYLLTTDDLIEAAVGELNAHKIVAWMHGAMEFGPRALGNRSLLASPLDPYSTENLNAFVKHREGFRKFAASVPAEVAAEYFDVRMNSRFLATVGRVRPAHRERFSSAILGEDIVRVHTVEERDNPLYWRLLHASGKSVRPE